jgi:hypothetical protein
MSPNGATCFIMGCFGRELVLTSTKQTLLLYHKKNS